MLEPWPRAQEAGDARCVQDPHQECHNARMMSPPIRPGSKQAAVSTALSFPRQDRAPLTRRRWFCRRGSTGSAAHRSRAVLAGERLRGDLLPMDVDQHRTGIRMKPVYATDSALEIRGQVRSRSALIETPG